MARAYSRWSPRARKLVLWTDTRGNANASRTDAGSDRLRDQGVMVMPLWHDLTRQRLVALTDVGLYSRAACGLLTCGTSLLDHCRQAAFYMHKILRGAKPADLPMPRPTRFELVLNLKTAKALGLAIPASLIARADEMSE